MEAINFFELEEERFKWSIITFSEATPEGSLMKAISELEEIRQTPLNHTEYADFVMCVFDCAQRSNISVSEILMESANRILPSPSLHPQRYFEVLNMFLNTIHLKIKEQKPVDASDIANIISLTIILANSHQITIFEILIAYRDKIEINKNRTWIKNPDNSYSHKKKEQ